MKKIKISKNNINIKNEDSDDENDIIIEDDLSKIDSEDSDELDDIDNSDDEDTDVENSEDSEDEEDEEEQEDEDEDEEDEEDSEIEDNYENNNNVIIYSDDENEVNTDKNININQVKTDSIKYLDAKIIKEFLNKPKITLPLITKFEYSKIKAIRITQLSNNANPFIKTTSSNIEEIADEEIKQMKLPFIIKRNLPNGEYELWKLSELATR
jgi:DNA-directed RNA polymerase subunit K/omega